MDERQQAVVAEMQEREKRLRPIMERLVADDPLMPPISAIVMAGDIDSSQRAYDELLEQDVMAIEPISIGKEDIPEHPRWLWAAQVRVGSYARMDFVKRLVVEGHVPPVDVFPHLLDLWRGSDAPDTDLFWLGMFHEAWQRNDREILLDSDKPVALNEWITVFRGQSHWAPVGFSWSLRKEVAEKFAKTGGGRAERSDGVVLSGQVSRSRIYAYMRERNEDEIISDSVNISKAR